MEPDDLILEEESSEEIKESRFRKFFIIGIAIFLIILLGAYAFVNAAGVDVLSGLALSFKAKENQVDFSFGNKLVFETNTLNELKEIYYDHPDVEFKDCLKGYKADSVYHITEISIPITYEQTFKSVTSEPCSSDSIVDLHSHPLNRCLPSDQDFKSFEEFKKRNQDALMAVMCQDDRFGIYE